ncbi:hypothetical protein MnTg01_01153 [archaeon MnTg01]|nr:hypothetical protein MnTg01_01153 [archaeon MnTg01]
MDENLILKIIEIQKSTKLDFILHLASNTFFLENVVISKSLTPVNHPTNRGGVYFSDTFVFKIKTTVSDLSLAPLLSQSMLGPNPDFQDLEITTKAKIDNSLKNVKLFGHLTNSMQSSSLIELNMNIIRIKLE